MRNKGLLILGLFFLFFLVLPTFVSTHGGVDENIQPRDSELLGQLPLAESNVSEGSFWTSQKVAWLIGILTLAYIITRYRNTKKVMVLVPQFLLGMIFLIHGVEALMSPSSFIDLLNIFNFGSNITKTLMVLVGLIDVIVFFLVIFRLRKGLLMYTAIWPIVPTVLTYISSRHIETTLIFSIFLSGFIFYTKYKKEKIATYKNK